MRLQVYLPQYINHKIGHENDDVIGTNVYNYLDPEFHEIHKKKVSEALNTGEIQKLEIKTLEIKTLEPS